MSFLEDLTFAQALMLLAAVYFGWSWARRYVQFGGTLHERVATLEIEVQRLSEETKRKGDADES